MKIHLFFAYLDPGSGSALVGTVIAVAGAALYSLKSLLYRLVRRQPAASAEPPALAIFSEGRNYWGTWRLIVEELRARGIPFAYYTLDLHDPALLIDDPLMHARLYDKAKAGSYAALARIQAKVLLATTPNIGTPGYPLRRAPGVARLVHVFHAFADVSAYHLGSLDAYDTVLTVGAHQEPYIREVERARGLPAKKMVPVGLPYFDAQYLARADRAASAALAAPAEGAAPTVLVAPSWGEKGCLREYGTDFICRLAEAGFDVIVRPHPQSYLAEADFLADCRARTARFPNVSWDDETVGSKAMERSAVLVSDTSSIRFDYAFLYGKPVVTLAIPRTSQAAYEGVHQKSMWTDDAAPRLGRVLDHDTVDSIVPVVREVLGQGASDDVLRFRAETIAHLGTSASAVVDALLAEVDA